MQKITPVDIQHKSFKKALQGYDRAEVDGFLDEVIETLRALGPVDVIERSVADEDVTFSLPKGVAG